MGKNIELYIHIPFCEKKCNYCDFLSFPAGEDVQERYVRKLIDELSLRADTVEDRVVSSIYIGGGTPSSIDARLIRDILKVIYSHYSLDPAAEITIEANPSSTMRHKLAIYADSGINRLSLGLQSASDTELKILGRVHSFEDFLKAYQSARMEGFKNINIDLMNGIPMQSPKSWRHTLREVCMMRPEHISVYDLMVEEGTFFYDMQEKGLLRLPVEEEQEALDELKHRLLKQYGFKRYEISNFAKDGYECRHNIGYWTGVEYLGYGIGSSSYYKGSRWKNIASLKTYIDSPLRATLLVTPSYESIVCEPRKLTKKEMMEEFMFLGLRMSDGVSAEDFKARFLTDIEDIYGIVLKKLEDDGFITHIAPIYSLTDRGRDLSNQILPEFLLTV